LKKRLSNDKHGKSTEETPTLGGVTAEQLDKSAQKGTAGIERSQTTHDKE
jgi:hypothetical protein